MLCPNGQGPNGTSLNPMMFEQAGIPDSPPCNLRSDNRHPPKVAKTGQQFIDRLRLAQKNQFVGRGYQVIPVPESPHFYIDTIAYIRLLGI